MERSMSILRACAIVGEPPVPFQIRTAAHQLAALIQTLDGLTPEQRCDLRMLPCDMLRWADALDREARS